MDGCPKCEWNSRIGEEGFYYVNGGECLDCTKYDRKSGNLSAKPPKGFKAYPIFGELTEAVWVSMEFGGNPVEWEETYLCPKCNEEFTFTNSSY